MLTLKKDQPIKLGYLFRLDEPGFPTGVTDAQKKLSGTWKFPAQTATP